MFVHTTPTYTPVLEGCFGRMPGRVSPGGVGSWWEWEGLARWGVGLMWVWRVGCHDDVNGKG